MKLKSMATLSALVVQVIMSSNSFAHDPFAGESAQPSGARNTANGNVVYCHSSDGSGRSGSVTISNEGYATAVWLYHPGQPPLRLPTSSYFETTNDIRQGWLWLTCGSN